MVCWGFEPGAAGWQAQTKPRSYGGHHVENFFHCYNWFNFEKNNLLSYPCVDVRHVYGSQRFDLIWSDILTEIECPRSSISELTKFVPLYTKILSISVLQYLRIFSNLCVYCNVYVLTAISMCACNVCTYVRTKSGQHFLSWYTIKVTTCLLVES